MHRFTSLGSRRFLAVGGRAVLVLAALAALGCDTKGFVDPTEMIRTSKDQLLLPIVSQADPAVEEANVQWANATEPTAEDLKPVVGDYRIAPNDLLTIDISDISGPGLETIRPMRVTNSGYISLPYLEQPLRAAGLTQIQLEQAIVDAYRTAGLLKSANVSVNVTEARGRAFKILGAVSTPGEYEIQEQNFRMLDALVLARGITSPFVEYIYVVRQAGPQPLAPLPTTAPSGTTPPGPTTNPSSEELAPPHVQGPASLRADYLDIVAQKPHGTAQVLLAAQRMGGGAGGGFDGFKDPQPDANSRVIRIPYQALRQGKLGYNIPIHPYDVIYVAEPQAGFYYVGGHVARPGTFTLAGAKVTIKQAIVSASMLDGVAIPQRTDLIRRIQPDRELFVRVDLEKIFAGEEPDIYLKPDDEILVGSNAFAPFMAAIRGAFRITYGFGFLYDRNYAYPTTVFGGVP